ncbi:hypothetical protein KP509_24G028700 [Ceratopteris richardii]|uniref:Uncharacterized protein n=1 Tax=Ceratopteris richardii TaxID=49495 RepID=A0A8T2RWC9_CERRI|nr:hypothetical protein KP509_24G028700 [Ceratopteris richardii]KAH7299779.1 hypothetical protein KP509_24G028700 [Ceratopteris richardii]
MGTGICREPTNFFLLAVGLRSFFLVLATHLLAGEVDTTFGKAPFLRRIWWWCRYYNPLNLSWRYYSMFAYRFTARSWGIQQLALINHEEHPFMPPLPYVLGETVHPLHVRRLEMAGLLSSQGVLTFCAAYQGVLAIEYAISTEGIPYLPNTTAPLAMAGLFRVMVCKWVASKIQVDAYPYPYSLEPRVSPSSFRLTVKDVPRRVLQMCKSCIYYLMSSLLSEKFMPRSSDIMVQGKETTPATAAEVQADAPSASNYGVFCTDKSNLKQEEGFSFPRPSSVTRTRTWPQISLRPLHLSTLQTTSALYLTQIPSPSRSSEPLLVGSNLHAVDDHSQGAGEGVSANACINLASSSPSSSFQRTASTLDRTRVELSTWKQASVSSSSFPETLTQDCEMHSQSSSPFIRQVEHYQSNKIIVAGWIGVLLGLLTMSFLPYKVAAAYRLPQTLLQFSMETFYQYIALSEFAFHGYLLYQGPRALANRVLFFDHWTLKAQTLGFFLLLMFMRAVALLDFLKNNFYQSCA